MLEQIGMPGKETISEPSEGTVYLVKQIVDNIENPQIAEVGVGIGATTLALCEVIQGKGTLHIFDFEKEVMELKQDLNDRGFDCVVAYGNTDKHWDSYHWSLLKLLVKEQRPIFDYVYFDGSHAALHELAALGVIERLLHPGGYIDFDDYEWTYANSIMGTLEYSKECMTEEQMKLPQVRMMVDLLVKNNPLYKEIIQNRVYQKQLVAAQPMS